MKNKLILILLCIALFIPSIIAIAYYAYMTATPVEQRELKRVDITGADGYTFTLERGNDKDVNAVLDLFVDMNKNAQQIDYKPELSDEYKLEFVYYNYAEEHRFDYYFPMTELTDGVSIAGGYYINEKDEVYKLATGDISEFMATTYSRSLYKNIAIPELTLAGSGNVIPQEIKWTFREVGGKYVNYDTSYNVTKDVKTYEIATDFGMSFSVVPDTFNVKITQGGTLVYEGPHADIPKVLEYDEDKPVSFEVTAQWMESLSTRYAGNIAYRFDANLIPPPDFSVTTADYEAGEYYIERGSVALVTAKNIKDASAITLTSSHDIGYEPTWLTDPETGTVYAFVPIPVELELTDGEEVVFTLSSGGTTEEIKLKGISASLSNLSDVNEGHYESEMQTILASLQAPTDGSFYFDGAFADPVRNLSNSRYRGFVRKADGEYYHTGVDIKDNLAGETVYAGAGGKVVYVGQFSAGENVVVIDHGLGLRSWYVNLNVDAGVIVGEEIQAGAVLGTCQEGVNLHCSVTVFGETVSPYKFWSHTNNGGGDNFYLDLK